MTTLLAYLRFGWWHYIRRHRYLRELAAAVIFHIFFWGFLHEQKPAKSIWLLLAVFAIILNVVTTPSLFYLEKGNTLHFLLSRPHGRRYFLLSKICLIVLIDLIWLGFFSLIYGLRFLQLEYFLKLPLHFLPIVELILLETLLLALSFTIRPQLSWLLFLLIVFGGIINKPAVFPVHGWEQGYKLLVFLLPPFQELSFLSMNLVWRSWQGMFALVGIGQFAVLGWLNFRAMMKKDLVG